MRWFNIFLIALLGGKQPSLLLSLFWWMVCIYAVITTVKTCSATNHFEPHRTPAERQRIEEARKKRSWFGMNDVLNIPGDNVYNLSSDHLAFLANQEDNCIYFLGY